MSLIKCPECGREISDKAECCTGCGCPASEWKNNQTHNEKNQSNETKDERTIILSILKKYSSSERVKAALELKNCLGIDIKDAKEIVNGYFSAKRKEESDNASQSNESCKWEIIRCGNIIFEFNETHMQIKRFGSYLAKGTISSFSIDGGENGYVRICHLSMPRPLVIERTTELRQIEQMLGYTHPNEFKGVYRYTFGGAKQEVYCPRCKSNNCSHYQEHKIIPGKTKTKYTANLNPLKPFTLVNKKEKVIKQEKVVTESKFICNSCGKIFN